MLYQDNIFKRPDFWMQQRINSATFTRWDLSVKQDLPWLGLQLFFNISNITGEDDVDVNQKNRLPCVPTALWHVGRPGIADKIVARAISGYVSSLHNFVQVLHDWQLRFPL